MRIRSRGRMPYVPSAIVDKPSEEGYYSMLVPSEKDINPFITVLHGARNDVLRINFVSMAIYECYLYAFGLPSNFTKEQIIVLGGERANYIPCRSCNCGSTHLYEYEVTVPASTKREEYQQRIINNFNEHFQLDEKVEKLFGYLQKLVKPAKEGVLLSISHVEFVATKNVLKNDIAPATNIDFLVNVASVKVRDMFGITPGQVRD